MTNNTQKCTESAISMQLSCRNKALKVATKPLKTFCT